MRNGGAGAALFEETQLFLHLGLRNGVLLRTAVDSVTGTLSDSRTRFLGTKAVRLYKVVVGGLPAMLALSSRPWVCYNYMSLYFMTPLSYDCVQYASNFSSRECPEGLVATCGDSLRIVTFDKLGELFNQTVAPLRYTPRKMAVLQGKNHLVLLETDHNMFSLEQREANKRNIYGKIDRESL